jgi:DNA-binding LacI/PurR family transcriptional regulator
MPAKKKRVVTIHDVARKAGVSVSTVSRVLNGKVDVASDTQKKVASVIAELGYTSSLAARSMRSRKTGLIGLLLNNLHNDFFVPLLNGVEAVVRQKQYNLIIATYLGNGQSAMPPIGPHNTDGLLVFSDGLLDDDLASLHSRGFPMVLVHRLPPAGLPVPSVTVENVEVTRSLIEHLIKVHGRRRIVFLRGPSGQQDSLLREEGYKRALQANGIQVDENLILNGEFERDIAYKVMNELLCDEKRVAFDAVFTGDDDAAIGVLKSLHEHGLQVPEDVAVIGFDDLGFAQFLHPPLTTVRAPTEAVGRLATERLFDLLEEQASNETAVLPTEIILRRSCGCEQQASVS